MFFNKLKKIKKIADKIDSLSEQFANMSDEELKNKTIEFKNRLKNGETLDDIMIEAYATVRETAKRTIGLYPFKVQLMGAVALHKGNIAEMKTGEGKTLVATLPAYLNALTGKGVHIVTVNDYLAKRDRENMGPIFEFLNLTVGLIQNEMNFEERKKAYACDITYVTNKELGFDYLRDNMARSKEQKVLRELNYCIIDEIDSILIDEARTPLIISKTSETNLDYYIKADIFVNILEEGKKIEPEHEISKLEKALTKTEVKETGDFIVDKKNKRVYLTEQGIKKAENFFKMKSYSDPENIKIVHHINNALKANYLFKKDIHYIVRNGKIEIVDEFTGRILRGRRYSDGLHQAIEVKEGVEIQPETKTLASITYQNLFRLYKKISGMTGTAKTEEEEFKELYGMEVIVIPTNKPVKRIDHDDVVFLTKKEKYAAIILDIKEQYKKGRPVLVGTTNIEVSELISKMLKNLGIPHTVLNAKNHEKEAEIIAKAGQKGAVTVATNMAGRGTDIKLGEGVRELGGLKVIGTERHESRRIDDQLRGRSGRQGDPGESIFYLSLEDDLMKYFGASKYINLFKSLGTPEGHEIKHPLITKSIRKAQKNIESINYSIRKTLMEYDNIINVQRKIIYEDREKLLNKNGLEEMFKIAKSVLVEKIKELKTLDENGKYDVKKLKNMIYELTGIEIEKQLLDNLNGEEIFEFIKGRFLEKIKKYDKELVSDIIKNIMLDIIDNLWSEHIDILSQLQREVSIQSYGGLDPMQVFIKESYNLFDNLIKDIQINIVKSAFRIKLASIK